MNMTEDELFAVLDAVSKLVQPDCDREPGEFSAKEYGERHGLPTEKARDMLRALVNKGKLHQREGRNKRMKATWYRIA